MVKLQKLRGIGGCVAIVIHRDVGRKYILYKQMQRSCFATAPLFFSN